MKVFKRVVAWVFISLILQSAIYLYLDKIYFVDEKNVKITNIDNLTKKKDLKSNIVFPNGASDIELSYDGSYTSFFDNMEDLKVIGTNSGKSINIAFNYNSKCIAYKWLPDANIIILAEEINVKKGKAIRFYSYDVEKENKKDIGNSTNNDDTISVKNKNIKVNIEVSTLTGVMYVKVSDNNISRIYRIDRNESMTRISLRGNKIGTIKVASHDDILAYEDQLANEIRITSGKKVIRINGVTDLFLLGVDGNDNIYVGENVNGRVSRLYFGKLSDDFTLWNNIKINNLVDPQNVIITYNGDIYLNQGQGSLLNLKINKKVSYVGQLLGIYNNYIASENNGKLILK